MTASTTRRSVLAAAGAASAAVTLAACGGKDSAGTSDSSDAAEGGGDDGGEAGGAAKGVLGKVADIPEGGGKVFKDEKVVVSQPKSGEFKAFSTICTHAKCPMIDLQGDVLSCNCHGSQFSIADGSVKKGPATQALDEKQLKVSGDSITLA
jgi:Rieske Fe-S protein